MLITNIISCCVRNVLYFIKLKKKCVEKSACTPQSKVLNKKHLCVSIETLASVSTFINATCSTSWGPLPLSAF